MRTKFLRKDNFIKTDRLNVLCGLGALLLVATLAVLCFGIPRNADQYDIVLLGDSVLANQPSMGGDKVHHYLQKELGKEVFEGAFGGSSMANRAYESLSFCVTEWSMVNLSKMICDKDFRSAKAAMSYAYQYRYNNRQVFEGYKDKMEGLSEIDFSKVEVLIIEHGTNDYNSGVRLDNEQDLYDEDTFGGGLRSVLKRLRETYPNLRIVLVTPAYCEVGGAHSSDDKDWGGGYLYQYVGKEIEIAKQFQVDVIDMYHNSGIHKGNVKDYTTDGLHLNDSGVALWGEKIADYLKGYVYED